MNRRIPLSERIEREAQHGYKILETAEDNWGWSTPAGRIRKAKRSVFLVSPESSDRESHVLEVGCGTGTFTGDLAKAFTRLVSIDVSEPLLEAAQKKYPQVEFRKEDIHGTTFPDDSFDLVLGCSVLHHLDWDLALKEIHRILRPGGELRFSEPNMMNPQIFLQKNWGYLKAKMGDSPDESAFTRSQIVCSLRSAGFAEIDVEPFEFLHPSTPQSLIPLVERIEKWIERTPLKKFAGSLRISSRK